MTEFSWVIKDELLVIAATSPGNVFGVVDLGGHGIERF
jgi:hypothetical protein